MTLSNKGDVVTQSGVEAGGSVAGRDLNQSTTVNNYYATRNSSNVNRLIELGKKYLEECEQNLGGFRPMIQKLEHYSSIIEEEPEDVIGLERKLTLGGYSALYSYAKMSKEQFVKHLTRHQFSEAAQKMYAILLVETCSCFQQYVYPSIVDGLVMTEVMELVRVKIFIYLEEKLGENVLDLYNDEICGMLYFLTGNCHIKWH